MVNSCLSRLVRQQAEKYGDKVALKYRDYTTATWIPVTWNGFADLVDKTARAFVKLGVEVQENVGVFSQNKPECLYVDFGAFKDRIVTVPLYATSSEAQVHYIVEDAGIRFLFVGEQYQYDVAYRVQGLCRSLKKIIIFDPEVKRAEGDNNSIYFSDFLQMGEKEECQPEVDKRVSESSLDDLANILYTSGTTGDSKGVMLHHSNYDVAFKGHNARLTNLGENDVVMNFLPFTHIFERAWSYYCLYKGCMLCINLRPQDIQKTIKEVRPTAMCSVPRFWEKVYAGVQEKINETTGLKKSLMLDALRVGREHNITYLMNGKTPPSLLHMKYKFYEKTIYSLLKKTIGIENGNFFPTAGAAIPEKVAEFVHSVGINMIAGYGLTESTATVSCEWIGDFRLGAVGRVLDGVEVRIGENNEIQLRGGTITKGYYKKEAITQQAFTEDGWFRTGDAGYMKDGFLYLTDRIKDLFKTSNGKYIAPQAIETKLVVDRYIDQVTIIADQRKFVSALIVPEYSQVEKFAQEHHIAFGSRKELLQLFIIKNRAQLTHGVFLILRLVTGFRIFNQDFFFFACVRVFILITQTYTRFYLIYVLSSGTTTSECIP
jgi:long-chain acyl-CoA synthetase